MGTRYTKKNLGDPNWSKPNNYKIKQNDAIYDVEIVPNKGVKGDISAQPFNDKNAEDIENALVSLDDDLAFIEADYINQAEHALKQDKTDNALTTSNKTVVGSINELVNEKQDKNDNGLTTTNKTVVGAINEVKADSEYYDMLQDDAIAIVNNRINALPMNGSLKNIITSLVGIPTSFTNIDMFNTKQTVTNYQPLSLDYKGSAEPHIVVMKTIGDYVFDFAIEATHTNGTDTTITLEAWVDGVLYDTATRTLVGASNQINGITGFFQYSKGSDAAPSEIYFRYKASQGNTSANKAMINTNLFGNSAESSFTDTDHVTGISLNEPTYNGATTSFIINDLRSDINTLQTTQRETSMNELGYDNTYFDTFTSLEDVIYDIIVNVNSKYPTVPVTVESYVSVSTHPNVFELMKAEINDNPDWENVNWGNAVLRVSSPNFNEGSTGMHEVTMFGTLDLGKPFISTFTPTTKTFSPWINEKGESYDIYVVTNDELSTTDFGLNLKTIALEFISKSKRGQFYKLVSYGESSTQLGNLQKSFIAYMNTQSNWDMSWYNDTRQLSYEFYIPRNVDANNGEFEVKVVGLDYTNEYNFQCEGDFVGVIKSNLTTNRKGDTQDKLIDMQMLNDFDIAYDDTIHGASTLEVILKDLYDKTQINVGNDKPFILNFTCRDATSGTNFNENLAEALKAFILNELGLSLTNWYIDFKMSASTLDGFNNEITGASNVVELNTDTGEVFQFQFDYDHFSDVKVRHLNLKQHWSLDELGLDGTWSLTDVPGNIKKAYDKVVSLIGNKTTFTITQPLYRNATADHYEFSQAIEDSIVDGYGVGMDTTGFEFSITFGLVDDKTLINSNLGNFIEIKCNNNKKFTRMFNYDLWANEVWTVEKCYTRGIGTQLYASGGNNEADITLSESILNFDTIVIRFKTSVYYAEEFRMKTLTDDGVDNTRFSRTVGYPTYNSTENKWTMILDQISCNIINPTTLAVIAGPGAGKYVMRGIIENNGTADNLLDADYGIVEVIGLDKRAVPRTSLASLNQPITVPEVGDNMQDTNVLKRVITHD